MSTALGFKLVDSEIHNKTRRVYVLNHTFKEHEQLELSKHGLEQRSVNIRWLLAGLLIGFFGLIMLVLVINISVNVDLKRLVAVDGLPSLLSLLSKEKHKSTLEKEDLHINNALQIVERRDFEAPYTIKENDREITVQEEFTHITTNLSTTIGVYEKNIKNLTLQTILNRESLKDAPIPTESLSEGISIIRHPIMASEPIDRKFFLHSEYIDQLIQNYLAQDANVVSFYNLIRDVKDVCLRGQECETGLKKRDSTFKSIEVNVSKKNVSVLNLSAPSNAGESLLVEKDYILFNNETLENLLARVQNGSKLNVERIVSLLEKKTLFKRNAESYGFRIQTIRTGTQEKTYVICRVIMFDVDGIVAIVALNDQGEFNYAPFKDRSLYASRSRESPHEAHYTTAELYTSILESLARFEVSKSVSELIIQQFAYDIDMHKPISRADRLDLLFMRKQSKTSEPVLLYAGLVIQGKEYKFFRYESPWTQAVDYYDQTGRSLKNFLMRKPLVNGRISSSFGYRFHPIAKVYRLHAGVDWAAPLGTPVLATGDGKVLYIQHSSSYGNRVVLEHSNGYVTTYNHLSALAKDLRVDLPVHQGQVIAYVGSTGVSTGAHCHYEVIINGHFVNPMKIKVPKSKELNGKELKDFMLQKLQLSDLLKHKAMPK